MIKIFNEEIDCAIEFKISTSLEKYFDEIALDGTNRFEIRNKRDSLSMLLAPRNIETHDRLLEILNNLSGALTVEYPISSTVTATRSFKVDEFDYEIEKDIQSKPTKFGAITLKVSEVEARV